MRPAHIVRCWGSKCLQTISTNSFRLPRNFEEPNFSLYQNLGQNLLKPYKLPRLLEVHQIFWEPKHISNQKRFWIQHFFWIKQFYRTKCCSWNQNHVRVNIFSTHNFYEYVFFCQTPKYFYTFFDQKLDLEH